MPFFFRIMTLEMVCDYLKISLEDLFKEDIIKGDKMPMAMIWCGYLAACKEMYQKPKFTEKDAERWLEFMPQSAREIYLGEITKLMGDLKKGAAVEI